MKIKKFNEGSENEITKEESNNKEIKTKEDLFEIIYPCSAARFFNAKSGSLYQQIEKAVDIIANQFLKK
jgi:hypothetical protein